MSNNDIARVYAASYIEVAQKNNKLDDFKDAIIEIVALLAENKDLSKYLHSPGVSKLSKKNIIKKMFENHFSKYVINFILLLIENQRLEIISDINDEVNKAIDLLENNQRVTIVSKLKLTNDIREKIISKLKKQLQKNIIITEKMDKSILGGIIIKIGDLVIDGSFRKDLKKIKNNLLNSKVRSEVAYEN